MYGIAQGISFISIAQHNAILLLGVRAYTVWRS